MSAAFSPGQVWNYHHRTGEEGSTLIILKTDEHEKGQIVHIRVNGIKLTNPNARGGFTDFIGHMPYSANALASCVTTLASENSTLPDFMSGYLQWKEAFDAGKAGIWTAAVKDAIEGIDQAMKGNRG